MKQMKKRVLSFVLILTIVMSMSSVFIPGVVAAEEEESFGVGELGLLQNLGILLDETSDYQKQLTRGELAHIAAFLSNIKDYPEGKSKFGDVTKDHPYYQEINALAVSGILNGDGNGLYRPDDYASMMELCKVFCTILGHENLGYFQDYRIIANRIGITDGIVEGNELTYAVAIKMAYNTLHTEMCEKVAYGDEVKYRVQDGFYALERYHGLVRQEGIVEGIYGTKLANPDSSIPEGTLLINGKYYQYDDESLLGQSVVFYCKKDKVRGELQKEIAYIYPNQEKNSLLEIKGTDVVGRKGNLFEYWVGSRKKSVKTADVPDVVYNGVAHPRYTEDDLKPGNGTVTLIDNNNDNVYDLIVVNAYEYAVCSGVNEKENVIYTSYPKGSIGKKDQDNNLTILHEKGKVRPSFLKQGDVLAVRVSKNGTGIQKIMVEVLSNPVNGTVDNIANKTFSVAGNQFEITSATVMGWDNGNASSLRAGEMVSVYTHQNFCAVVLRADAKGYQFGYLVQAKNNVVGWKGNLVVQVVDNQRVLHEYNAAEKLKVDEIPYTDIDAVLLRLETSAKETYQNDKTEFSCSQPIRYQLNKDGKLTHIDTLIYEEAYETKDSLQGNAPIPYVEDENGKKTYEAYLYISNSGTFEQNKADGNTIFSLPASDSILMVANNVRNKPQYYPTGSLETDKTYYVEGYTVDPDTMIAKYAVVYQDVSMTALDDLSRFCIVSELSRVCDAEGSPVSQVTVIDPLEGKKQLKLVEQAATAQLEIGDVVRYAGAGDEITMIERSFPIATKDANPRILSSSSGKYSFAKYRQIAYGTIWAIGDNIINHTTSITRDIGGVENRKNSHNFRPTTQTYYYVYDNINGEPVVKDGSIQDIVPYKVDPTSGQNAIIFSESAYLRIVYIIK